MPHVHVEETPMRKAYALAKHPAHLVRRMSVQKNGPFFGTSMPPENFLEAWED